MSTLQALITQEEQELPQGSPVIVGMLKTPEPEPEEQDAWEDRVARRSPPKSQRDCRQRVQNAGKSLQIRGSGSHGSEQESRLIGGAPMPQATLAALPVHFASLPDPRVVGRTAYPLENILFIAVTAVICGVDTYTGMACLPKPSAPGWRSIWIWRVGCPRMIPSTMSFRS